MASRSAFSPCVQALLAMAVWAGVAQAQGDDPDALAKRVLNQSGVQGGIIVHLGCGDGKLTAALRAGDQYAVQGLEADPAKVAQARDPLRATCMVPASGARERAPYTDNYQPGRVRIPRHDGRMIVSCAGGPFAVAGVVVRFAKVAGQYRSVTFPLMRAITQSPRTCRGLP
jgi:hypothetical protein